MIVKHCAACGARTPMRLSPRRLCRACRAQTGVTYLQAAALRDVSTGDVSHRPMHPLTWQSLLRRDLVEFRDGQMVLTPTGEKALRYQPYVRMPQTWKGTA